MSRMTTALALGTVALLTASACSDATRTVFPPLTADLRVMHATPSLGAVDVLVDGTPVVSGLTYGTSSALLSVTGGMQNVEVRSAGQTLGSVQYSLAVDHVNSLFIADSAPQFGDSVVSDTGQAAPTLANLRLVNVVGSNTSPPTQLKVLILGPNGTPDSVVTSNLDATIPAYWSLMYWPAGAFNIRYVAAADTSVEVAQVSFVIAVGEKKAVMLQRADDGTYSATAVTEP